MSYVGNVTAGGATHLVGSTLYGTCGTAAATAAKVVTCANFDQLLTGVTIHVKFTYTNTVANPTLNVNNTGAKSIYRYGTTAPSTTAATSWNAGAVVAFTYDGSAWVMNDWLNNDTNTTYSDMTAATASAAGKSGLVPAPGAGKQASFLRGDGTWAVPDSTDANAMTKANPIGTGYLSMNSRSSTPIYYGAYSTTLGYLNMATGPYSTAIGYYATANGSVSTAIGYYISALANQLAIGHYNNSSLATAGNDSDTTGTALVIGNGTSASTLSNACRITYAGQVIGKSSYSTSGADYAEFREWADGNLDNEDRRGYFVTLVDDKIQIASPGDYIEGIISGHPAVIGNYDECWSGQFLKDEWGEYILEDVEVEDPETGEKSTGKWYKQNPDYDPEMKYIPREERPEWSPVGMLGHLSVRDDGTCEPNGYCKVAEGGIATASDRGYRVVKRISDNIVEIVFSIYAQF